MESPDFWNNLTNFGFSTMSAASQPGATTLGAIGQGGMGMNQAAMQRAQTQNIGQEATGKTLNNAMALRQLNLGNAAMGLQPITMKGVPDLLNQTPSGATASQPWSNSAGHSPSQQTYSQPSGGGNSSILDNLGVAPSVMEVAMQKRMPATADEAVQAARVAGYLGNTEWAKQLTTTAMKGAEPYELRPGGVRGNPLGGQTIVNPAHVQDATGVTRPFAPAPITYGEGAGSGQGVGGRNAGGGLGGGIKTGFSPQEKSSQESYFGPETQSYHGAQSAMQNLELMQHSIDALNNEPGFFSTGSAGAGRIAFGKAANTFLTSIGAEPLDESKIAAGESLFKTSGRLGFNMSKQLGSREPGVITQQAIALNPGMDNTPKGVQLLKNSVQEEQQRIIDEHNFKGTFYAQNGYNQQAAEAAFDARYKPALYAKRATSQLDPIKVNTPAAAKGLLAGTKIMTPKGLKIIPPQIGITAPVYSAPSQPNAQMQPQEEPE